jgi:hypothetical protein
MSPVSSTAISPRWNRLSPFSGALSLVACSGVTGAILGVSAFPKPVDDLTRSALRFGLQMTLLLSVSLKAVDDPKSVHS